MFHVNHPKLTVAIAPLRTRTSADAVPRIADRSPNREIAAPLTLAAVVLGALGFAIASALVTALGG